MNVASLELCKELYEVSGWETEDWFDGENIITAEDKEMGGYDEDQVTAAYSLGYLLRKLPETRLKLRNYKPGWAIQWTDNRGVEYGQEADAPENAACMLAIELLKAGVLQKDAA